MSDLEARKKLLVAESEVYRQTLKLDIQNVRLYSMRVQRKWSQYALLKPCCSRRFAGSQRAFQPQAA
jgi:hypothetical protein